MAKPSLQGPLKVHHCSAAGVYSPPEKQTNLKAHSSVQQISVEPGQSGEGEMKEHGKEQKVKEKGISQCTGIKMLAAGGKSGTP